MSHSPRSISTRAVSALVLLLVAVTLPAIAADKTWDGGGGDNNWLTGANWDADTAPAANDALFFDGSTRTTPNNNFPAGTGFDNITFNGGADLFTLGGNGITLVAFTNGIDASTVTPVGGNITNASGNPETVSLPITLTAGRHSFANAGGGTLSLSGAMTRNTGATAVFLPTFGNINVTGALSTNGLNNILGAWATDGGDWATVDGSGNIIAFSAYTDISTGAIVNDPTSNVRYISDTANITAASGTTINSLLTLQGAARSLTITGQLKFGSRGGIYRLGSGVMTITGGSVTANGGGELTFSDSPFNATGGNNLNIVSLITNDNANAVSVNIMGYVQFGQASTAYNGYSGGTYINQGRVQITPLLGFGTGPVYVFPGGQILFNSNGTYTNDFFIGGVGSAETGGLGAFRMGGAARIVSGRVTLMGDAVIGNNGRISGPITGPGALFIGHGTSGNGHGVIQVGGAVANDYNGDTTIGSANQAADTLQINATFNNVMPHGAGKGNVILNAGSSAITATFDLNGTTQTINGLTNSAASPVNNIVTNSSATAATLVLGDSNVTSTFAGKVGGNLSLTKIGSGTQTFTGTGTYSNATTVNGGSLVFSVSGSFPAAAPAITVNSNAILDLSDVCPVTLAASSTLTSSNGATILAPQASGNAITTSNLTAIGATNYVGITSIPSISTYPAQFVVIKYTTLNGALNFGLAGSLPPSPSTPFAGYISNNVANNSVDLVVTSGPASIKWVGYSSGAPNSSWDSSTANWATLAGVPTTYTDGNFARFDNSASNGVVSLDQVVSPAGVTVTNTSLTYTIGGPNYITGIAGLTKQGSGTLILDHTGVNDFSGGVTISAGTLQIGNNDAAGNLPAGSLVDNGALVFARNDTVTVPNLISGNGSVAMNGSGTLVLNAANTFTGAVTVAQGTLQTGNSSALGTTNGGTVVASGATLDITANAINLGQEVITVSGTGVGGNGALINSSALAGFVGPNAARVIMVGDTTVGGSGRFDLRSNPTSNPGLGSLSTTNAARKITKIGTGTFGLIGITVDAALGDIEIKEGVFSTEAAITGLGNVNSNVIVYPAATFQMFAVTNLINKVFTIGGDGSSTNVSATSGANTIIGPMAVTNDAIFNVNGAAVTLTLSNVITGPGKITKVGAGLLTFSGNSPAYAGGLRQNSGNMTVNGTLGNALGVYVPVGKFTLNGNMPGTGGLTNDAGTTVAGSGTNGGPADVSGFLFPGDTNVVGTLTLGGLITESASTIGFDLGFGTTPGVGNDLVQVNGNLVVNGGNIVINPQGGLLQAGQSYRLFNYTGSLIWNSDFTLNNGINNYNFTINTNTPGQVNLIPSGGPPVWNGASLSDSFWSSSANWAGVSIAPGNSLFFAGSTRLNNTNDTAADQPYTDLGFVSGAGSFTLNGNSVTLGGSVNNNSANPQTVNLALQLAGNRSFNGNTAVLNIMGGVTNTANGTFLTLGGTGVVANLMTTLTGTETNVLATSFTNASWTLIDNPTSGTITNPVQLDIEAGTLNFGSVSAAPKLYSSTANNSRIGVSNLAPATLNMVNGNLTITVRLNTGVAANSIAAINQSGGTINVQDVLQLSDGANTAFTTANITGGLLSVADGAGAPRNMFLCSRGTGIVTIATSGVLSCATLDMSRNAAGNTSGSVGVINLNSGGLLAASRLGTATSAAQAGGIPTANLNFNGGTLKANASSTTWIQGNAAGPVCPIVCTIKSGGAIIDTTNFNVSILEPLQHDSTLGATLDGGLVKKGTGTLTIPTVNSYTGPTAISNGTLMLNGTLSGSAVTVATGGTLAGNGNVGKNLDAQAGSTVSPGTSVGILNVTNAISLAGTTIMEINAALGTNDLLRSITGNVSYGGTLTVTNLGGLLTNGQSFKLFHAGGGSYAGVFPTIQLPGLGSGQSWVNSLAASGTISVSGNPAPPTIGSVTPSGGNLLISGGGGVTNGTYTILSSTNVGQALATWTVAGTGSFDANGNFSTNVALDTNTPQRFFAIRMP